MRIPRPLRLVVLVLVGLLALTSCRFDIYSLPLPGGADTGDQPMTIKVDFADVLDLVPESTVKVADVSVGKVSSVDLVGDHARVTLVVNKNVDLPANATAAIRQTSLLGEKFVSLSPPTSAVATGRLANGALIPLARTGRNPEVEEVLGALSLILNGGGVAQLKTISHELSKALEGHEGSAKSVLRQLSTLVGRLDHNRGDIVHAIESVNKLSISVTKQLPAIDSALEELPGALDSLNRQRDDLRKMLKALAGLSDVGVRVIKASKESTLGSLHDLEPVLKSLADAGDALPYSLQVLFTYPFTDAVVSRDPQTARNLHMGDFVNLSVQLDLSLDALTNGPLPTGQTCVKLGDAGGLLDLSKLCQGGLDAITKCYTSPSATNCNPLAPIADVLCKSSPLPLLCGTSGGSTGGTGGATLTPLQKLQQSLGGLLKRAGPADDGGGDRPTYRDLMQRYDPALVSLLVPGVTR